MADGVIIVDASGNITFQNEAARRLLGGDGVDLSLEAWLETIQLLAPDGAPLPFEETWLARTVRGGEASLGVECRIRLPDDTEIIVHGSATPVIAEDGSRYGSVFTFRDITEHKQMEEARSALAAIVESSSDAIIRTTMDGIITGWDRGAERLYGYHASDAIGQPISLIVPPDRADEVSVVLAQLKKGESVEHVETVRRHKDGHWIDISASVSPIRDASGTITGALSIAHDIGKRKRLERERAQHQKELTTRVLQAQEHERQRIARELHDDTAQSLSSLLISLDLLETHIPKDEPALRVGFDRVRGIARRALDSTRTLAHGLRPTILDDFGLDAALEWIAVDHTRTFGVPVRVVAKEIPAGRVGPEAELALFRIAQEALTNSGRHARATAVHMALSSSRGAVKLVVEDDGKGFDVESLAGASRESGLGLHGIQERVQLLGAVLDVQSAPGKGTRISVTVPLVRARARPRRRTTDVVTGRTPC
jgi:PAS domain S-box-containing protein